MLVIIVVQAGCGSVDPGDHGCVSSILADAFIGFVDIEIPDSFPVRIQENNSGMKTIHTGMITEQDREGWHPAALVIHADE